jgi:hypothetical protein
VEQPGRELIDERWGEVAAEKVPVPDFDPIDSRYPEEVDLGLQILGSYVSKTRFAGYLNAVVHSLAFLQLIDLLFRSINRGSAEERSLAAGGACVLLSCLFRRERENFS